MALSNVGTVLFLLGDVRQAAAHQEQAAAALAALGDKRNRASVLVGLARTLDQSGRPEAALERFDEALALAHEVGDRRGEGWRSWVARAFSSPVETRRRRVAPTNRDWH